MTSERFPKLHYAWVVCLCGVWLFLCNMGLCSNLLSVYLPFIEATGLSHSMGSAIISIRCLFSFIATFLVGQYYRRFSLRLGVFIATLIGALSAVVYSIGGGAFVYYVGAALGGVAYGLGTVFPVSLLMTNWFHTSRGAALGVSSAGSGLGTMIFSSLTSSLVVRYSLRTAFLLEAAFMAVSAAVVFLLIRDDPADKGLSPYGAGGAGDAGTRAKEGPAELPASVVWMLALMMLIMGGAGQAFAGHLSVLARSSGYSAQTAASAVSLYGLMMMCSKLSSGGLADRFGSKRCTSLLMAIFVLGSVLVRFMNGTDLFWCFAPICLIGFGASVYNVGPPLWAGDLSDRAGYPKLLRWLQLFFNLGGILFSTVPGVIADHTGEYKSSYLLIAAMILTALLILRWSYWRGLSQRSET